MNAMQKIRLGLMIANIKLGRIFSRDYSGPKDPNPENWRTISGAHVHIDENGRIDGGAGGKFEGREWSGKTAHGSEREGRIRSHIEKMNVSEGTRERLLGAIGAHKEDKETNQSAIASIEARIRQQRQKVESLKTKKAKEKAKTELAKLEKEREAEAKSGELGSYFEQVANENRAWENEQGAAELNNFLSAYKGGEFEHKPKGGSMASLFPEVKKGGELFSGPSEAEKRHTTSRLQKAQEELAKQEAEKELSGGLSRMAQMERQAKARATVKALQEQAKGRGIEVPDKSSSSAPKESPKDYNGFLTSKAVANESAVRAYLEKPIELWDDKTQSRKKMTMAEYIENFTETPGAEFSVKLPPKGLGGAAPQLVYQNSEMKKRNYAPTVDPIGFAYGKYLLEAKAKN